jgi:hypothetical protein
MRNTILAAAAAFALVVATAPSFAAPASESNGGQAQSQNSNSHNDAAKCADILANQSGHQASEVEFCKAQQ